MNWSEQRPVEETGNPARTKRGNLLQVTLVVAVTQPGVAREPPVAAQHEVGVVDLSDPPPVDLRAEGYDLGGTRAKSFTHETAEDESKHPAGSSTVPTEFPAYVPKVASQGLVEALGDRE